jgi:PKD repeat protein
MSSGLQALAGIIVAVAAGAGCAVHQSDSAPPLTGPSGLAQSVTVSTTPDRLTQDGQSQSAVVVQVTDANGRPASAVPIRVDMLVGGTLQDYGSLASRSIVTGADGKAGTVYTAPPPPGTANQVSNTVTIRAAPIGSNAQSSLSFTADIRLVTPGVILPPGGAPTATFSASPTSPVAGTVVNFDGSASVPGNGASSILSYTWAFGDGTTGTGRIATHVYATGNTYNVTLTVTNDRGISTTSNTTPLTVAGAVAPAASFVFSPSQPAPGATVFFNAVASAAAAGHSIVDYRWSFGNGETAQGQTATQSYASPGTYIVTLTVADDLGQQATTTQSVTVATPKS